MNPTPLLDDLKDSVEDEELERRRFLALLGSGALGLAGFGTVIAGISYLEPDVLYEEDGRVEIGKPETIPVNTVLVSRARKLYVVHTPDGFYALSAICTHLGCVTRHEPERDRIVCPCHGSSFDLEGRVLGGPAPSPLVRLKLSLHRGVLVVDTSQPAQGETLKV